MSQEDDRQRWELEQLGLRMQQSNDPEEINRIDKEIQEGKASGRFGEAQRENAERMAAGLPQLEEIWNQQGANQGVYTSPGSVEYDPEGQFAAIPLQDSHLNDVSQARTQGAMNFGLGEMTRNRGEMATENGRLAGREAQSRGDQGAALDMSMRAAMGQAPSEAASKTTQGLNGLMGSYAAAQGGARGLSALTGAGLGGSAIGAGAGNVAAQGAFGRSQEIGQAMGEYGGLAGAARGQDLSRLAQNSQNSNFNADLNDAWKLGQGKLAVEAGKVGNAMDLMDQRRYGASMEPAKIQFGADTAMAGIQQGANTDRASINYAKSTSEDEDDERVGKSIGGAGAGLAGSMVGGPAGGYAAKSGFDYALS